MIRSSYPPRSKTRRVPLHLGILPVLVVGCMVHQVSAQPSLTAWQAARLHSRIVPGLRSSTAPASESAVALTWAAGQDFDLVDDDLGGLTMVWATDAFPIAIAARDSYARSAAIGNAGAFDMGLQALDGPDALRVAQIRAAIQNERPLFPLRSIFTRGVGPSANGRSSSNLFSLATLSGMMRGDFYLPFRSPARGLRFDYVDNLRPKASAWSRGSASAMFTSALMHKGMTFSAGALIGVRPTALSAGGGLHSMASVAERNTVPSLGMRLSF